MKLQPAWQRYMASQLWGIASILVALLAIGVLILALGVNPLKAYASLIIGAFGSGRGLTETALQATPLLLIGLGLVLAFRCKVWNIGAEGQFIAGALCSTWLGLAWGETLPAVIMLPLMLLAGALGGAVWGAIPGILKARRGLSEIVVSLMLNYVALFGVSYIVRSPLKNPEHYLPQTAPLPLAAQLPVIPGTRLHLGIFIALACTVVVYYLLWHTSLGYELRAVGSNPSAAEAAGISVSGSVVLVMMLSGGLAGLAGTIQVAGIHHHLSQETASGLGYTAILIAILGQLNPTGVFIAALLFGALVIGADYMHRAVKLQQALVAVVQATIVLFYLCGTALGRREE